jgi:nucleotide-binding universal stress UspA family protein
VIVVPLDRQLDAELPVEEEKADRLLDEARLAAAAYGIRTIDRIARARHAGRAIADEAARRQAEIVVLGAPRGRHRAIFGDTVDYVLRNAPCRVMVAAGKRAA